MDEYTYKGYTFRRTNYYAKQLRNGCFVVIDGSGIPTESLSCSRPAFRALWEIDGLKPFGREPYLFSAYACRKHIKEVIRCISDAMDNTRHAGADERGDVIDGGHFNTNTKELI